jgi:DNA-binding transcriptional regulator YbjK
MQETPRKGSDTRERLLDVSEAAVQEKGFAATSIEEVIAAVGITKSGFFYHFKDKNDLAKAHPVQDHQGQAGARQADAALPRFHQGGVPRRPLNLGTI